MGTNNHEGAHKPGRPTARSAPDSLFAAPVGRVGKCGNHDTCGAKLKGRVEGARAWRDAAPGAGLRSGIEGLMA